MKVKSESEVAQSCPTLSDPMDYSLPGSSVHGIFQARVLEWVPLPSLQSLLCHCHHSNGKGLGKFTTISCQSFNLEGMLPLLTSHSLEKVTLQTCP